LEAHSREDIAIFTSDDLELGEAFFQLVHGKASLMPKTSKGREILKSGAARNANRSFLARRRWIIFSLVHSVAQSIESAREQTTLISGGRKAAGKGDVF
jgi:hypothetical protein